MGNTDSIPAVSQIKSGVQLVCGDTAGAARTQKNFIRECPGVSQVTSVVQVITGDTAGALETQKRCGKGLLKMADGVPVVGHVKGVIHYACGDKEGGHQAMKSATRTTGVIAGGAGGFIVGGPAGAVAGGIYGGVVMDSGTTIVTKKPAGYIAAIGNAIENPNPGDIFDLALMPVADGLAGYSGGKIVDKLQKNVALRQNIKSGKAMEAQGQALLEATEAKLEANPDMTTGEYMDGMNKAQKLVIEGRKLQDNPIQFDQLKPQQNLPKSGTSSSHATVAPSVKDKDGKTKEKEKDKKRTQVYYERKSKSKTRYSDNDTSSDEEDEECICTELKLRVLYVNIRSLNPKNKTQTMSDKIGHLKALIKEHDPCIIAFVETWLKEKHSDLQVLESLELSGYEIVRRQDRERAHLSTNAYEDNGSKDSATRGGGILVAWKNKYFEEVSIKHDDSEDFRDNVVNTEIVRTVKCRKCSRVPQKKFAFTVIYRPPGEVTEELYNRLVHIPSYFSNWEDPFSGWAMCGDFNWSSRKPEWLESLLVFADNGEIVQLSKDATHERGAALDQILANPGFVDGRVIVTDFVSDHSALVFNLNLGRDLPPGEDECKAHECS